MVNEPEKRTSPACWPHMYTLATSQFLCSLTPDPPYFTMRGSGLALVMRRKSYSFPWGVRPRIVRHSGHSTRMTPASLMSFAGTSIMLPENKHPGMHRPCSIGAKYGCLDKMCPNSVYSCWMYRTSVLVSVPWKGYVFAQEVASATRAYDIHLLPLLLTSRDVTGLASHSFGAVPFSPLSLCGALDLCSSTAIVCHCHTEHIVWYHNPSSGRILPAMLLSKGTTCSGPVSRGFDRFCIGEGAMESPLYVRERSMSG